MVIYTKTLGSTGTDIGIRYGHNITHIWEYDNALIIGRHNNTSYNKIDIKLVQKHKS